MLASGSGVHAVLFYGPRGAGKGRLARILASSWLCLTPVEGIACGECAVCKAFQAGRAVDFQYVPPWGPSDLIKTSALYPTPDWEKDKERPPIEFVLHYFRTRPLMARNKVVLFDRCDRMNSSTANAFLKTLEEPGSQAKIILTTEEFSRVLPTIRSRCMCVACELQEPETATGPEAAFGGSPGTVAQVRAHPEVFERLYNLLERTRTAPFGAAFRFAEECRGIAEAYGKAADLNPRAANVAVLEWVGSWLARERADRPEQLLALAEAHRRVQGNVNAGPVFETLFLDLLYHG